MHKTDDLFERSLRSVAGLPAEESAKAVQEFEAEHQYWAPYHITVEWSTHAVQMLSQMPFMQGEQGAAAWTQWLSGLPSALAEPGGGLSERSQNILKHTYCQLYDLQHPDNPWSERLPQAALPAMAQALSNAREQWEGLKDYTNPDQSAASLLQDWHQRALNGVWRIREAGKGENCQRCYGAWLVNAVRDNLLRIYPAQEHHAGPATSMAASYIQRILADSPKASPQALPMPAAECPVLPPAPVAEAPTPKPTKSKPGP